MYTKSKIQQIIESIEMKNNFKDGLKNLMEKYNIEDSIFVSYCGNTKEVTGGYFTIREEVDSIDKAVELCDIRTEGIRIMENQKFQIGCVCGLLSACPKSGKILDIDKIKYVNE